MKKIPFIILLSILICGISSSEVPFTAIYWIRGAVVDAPAETANGKKIYFENSLAWDIIGPEGRSGKPNQFLINAGDARVPLEAGRKYSLFTEKVNNFGVGPVEIELSGIGFERVGPFAMGEGKGIADLRAMGIETEPLPKIKIWFGNRVYQKQMVEQKGIEFFAPRRPKIKMEVKINKPHTLSADPAAYSLSVDDTKTYSFPMTSIEEDRAVFEISFLGEPLEPGKHTFTFKAQSSGKLAASSTALETARVTITGGPLKILDQPLCYPSPFNPERDKTVTFQYTLSDNADIDLFVFSAAGQIVKKISIEEGDEGGAGQLNKVEWNGMTEQGTVMSSGVYLVNIVSRQDKKVLGKIKLTIVR